MGQRPEDVTICDYYTPIITGKENSGASQQELMLKITHTFILGNYTTPNTGIAVAGVVAPGEFNGKQVYLLPYFTGGYESTNFGGSHGVANNFLDDGGAVPLLNNEPANGTNSQQYTLLTHVYQYFGTFYGCSHQGEPEFPQYGGRASQYEVHKYMDLNAQELGYFNQQVALAVQSLGFSDEDVAFTKRSLETVFSHRCSPPATVIPVSTGPQLQSCCLGSNCPLDPNATCDAYPDKGRVEMPAIANATSVGNLTKPNDTDNFAANGSSGASGTAAAPTASGTNVAGTSYGIGFGKLEILIGIVYVLVVAGVLPDVSRL